MTMRAVRTALTKWSRSKPDQDRPLATEGAKPRWPLPEERRLAAAGSAKRWQPPEEASAATAAVAVKERPEPGAQECPSEAIPTGGQPAPVAGGDQPAPVMRPERPVAGGDEPAAAGPADWPVGGDVELAAEPAAGEGEPARVMPAGRPVAGRVLAGWMRRRHALTVLVTTTALALLAVGVVASTPRTSAAGVPVSPVAARGHARTGRPVPAKVAVRYLRLRGGARVMVATISGDVRFVLHCGSLDPGPLCHSRGLVAGNAVGPAERPDLIAAFNGGFKLSAHAGGYEQEGKVLSPLLPGLASFVIYSSGSASIGIWGTTAPLPGQQVYSVRQNLRPLVLHGTITPATVANWGNWGGTVTNADNTARSAVGETASGSFVYVSSMSATPPDLADALIKAGAVIGMELDINADWVQFDYATEPGGPLRKAGINQWRPADQYITGWDRDFIAVLADTPPSRAPGLHTVP